MLGGRCTLSAVMACVLVTQQCVAETPPIEPASTTAATTTAATTTTAASTSTAAATTTTAAAVATTTTVAATTTTAAAVAPKAVAVSPVISVPAAAVATPVSVAQVAVAAETTTVAATTAATTTASAATTVAAQATTVATTTVAATTAATTAAQVAATTVETTAATTAATTTVAAQVPPAPAADLKDTIIAKEESTIAELMKEVAALKAQKAAGAAPAAAPAVSIQAHSAKPEAVAPVADLPKPAATVAAAPAVQVPKQPASVAAAVPHAEAPKQAAVAVSAVQVKQVLTSTTASPSSDKTSKQAKVPVHATAATTVAPAKSSPTITMKAKNLPPEMVLHHKNMPPEMVGAHGTTTAKPAVASRNPEPHLVKVQPQEKTKQKSSAVVVQAKPARTAPAGAHQMVADLEKSPGLEDPAKLIKSWDEEERLASEEFQMDPISEERMKMEDEAQADEQIMEEFEAEGFDPAMIDEVLGEDGIAVPAVDLKLSVSDGGRSILLEEDPLGAAMGMDEQDIDEMMASVQQGALNAAKPRSLNEKDASMVKKATGHRHNREPKDSEAKAVVDDAPNVVREHDKKKKKKHEKKHPPTETWAQALLGEQDWLPTQDQMQKYGLFGGVGLVIALLVCYSNQGGVKGAVNRELKSAAVPSFSNDFDCDLLDDEKSCMLPPPNPSRNYSTPSNDLFPARSDLAAMDMELDDYAGL